MGSKKNTARTMKVGQIRKSPILALGTSPKDIRNYEKVTVAYGSVMPVIVGGNETAYNILEGQARYMAYTRKGYREMPVIVAQVKNEAEQMKLSLLLSTIHEEGGAISEGEFIQQLIMRHGITSRELTKLLGKSKAWLSKRRSLASNLTEAVKGMVSDGVLCARSAEEIAKLPARVQIEFAASVARDDLNKTEVTQLVRLYRSEGAGEQCRQAIVASPLTVLPTLPEQKVNRRRKDSRSDGERLAGAARYAIRLHYELKGLIASANNAALSLAAPHLGSLRESMSELDMLLSGIIASFDIGEPLRKVSPGKPLTGGIHND